MNARSGDMLMLCCDARRYSMAFSRGGRRRNHSSQAGGAAAARGGRLTNGSAHTARALARRRGLERAASVQVHGDANAGGRDDNSGQREEEQQQHCREDCVRRAGRRDAERVRDERVDELELRQTQHPLRAYVQPSERAVEARHEAGSGEQFDGRRVLEQRARVE